MFKKAGIIALAAAALLLAGSPAFADSAYPLGAQYGAVNSDGTEQFGAVNIGDLDVADTVTIPVCVNDTNVAVGILVAAVVDGLSPSGQVDSCDAAIANENGRR